MSKLPYPVEVIWYCLASLEVFVFRVGLKDGT